MVQQITSCSWSPPLSSTSSFCKVGWHRGRGSQSAHATLWPLHQPRCTSILHVPWRERKDFTNVILMFFAIT